MAPGGREATEAAAEGPDTLVLQGDVLPHASLLDAREGAKVASEFSMFAWFDVLVFAVNQDVTI